MNPDEKQHLLRWKFPEVAAKHPGNWGKAMRPKHEAKQPQRELFQIDLEQLVDSSHPLVRLGQRIDWSSFEQTVTNHLTRFFLTFGARWGC